jgi:hypothetical protein
MPAAAQALTAWAARSSTGLPGVVAGLRPACRVLRCSTIDETLRTNPAQVPERGHHLAATLPATSAIGTRYRGKAEAASDAQPILPCGRGWTGVKPERRQFGERAEGKLTWGQRIGL